MARDDDEEVCFRISSWLDTPDKPCTPLSPCELGRSSHSIARVRLKAPSFSGAGHDDARLEWVAQNLPLGFNEDYDWQGEASISWNVAGGSPSEHYNYELARAVECYAKGREYSTPRGDWNADQVKTQKARIDAGADYLTPTIDSIT